MKKHLGKIILFGFAAFSVLTVIFLKQVFDKAPELKAAAVEQLRTEFLNHTATKHPSENIPVASVGETAYTVSLKNDWKFEIHDKTLVIFPPALNPAPDEADAQAAREKATETISTTAKAWLEEKFHSTKDLLVEVRWL